MKRRDFIMPTLITVKNKESKICTAPSLEQVRLYLPYGICFEMEETLKNLGGQGVVRIEEIRLRSGRRVSLTVGCKNERKNIFLSTVMGEDELFDILNRMCGGSMYAYSESIIRGYVALEGGIRVGVCGRASVEDGAVLGVRNISALNIRLPCALQASDRRICDIIRASVLNGEGTLIYSPPAQGKTTLLRSLAFSLSQTMRVALVDTREEFGGCFNGELLSLDILSGYPKEEGIRIATAFMNPELIICDEIGAEEAPAIAEAQNCGVPLLASTHGKSCEGILRRKGMRMLHEAGVFGLYLGIRISYGRGFEYDLKNRRDVSFGDMGDNSYSF